MIITYAISANFATLTWFSICSIFGIIIVLGIAWSTKCIVMTKSGTITIVGKWGQEAIKIITDGLAWIWWPCHQVMDNVSTERRTFNILAFKLMCSYKAVPKGKVFDEEHNTLIELITGEVSPVYQVYFTDSTGKPDHSKLTGYYEVSVDGKLSYEKIEEMIKDIFQSLLKDEVNQLGLFQAISTNQDIIKTIMDKINAEYGRMNLPIRLLDLNMNKFLEPTDPKIIELITSKSLAKLKKSAAEDEKAALMYEAEQDKIREIYIAEQNVRIAELEGDAIIIKTKKIAEAYGFDKLPPENQAIALLKKEALGFYLAVLEGSNSKIIMMPNLGQLMSEVEGMFKTIASQGGN